MIKLAVMSALIFLGNTLYVNLTLIYDLFYIYHPPFFVLVIIILNTEGLINLPIAISTEPVISNALMIPMKILRFLANKVTDWGYCGDSI